MGGYSLVAKPENLEHVVPTIVQFISGGVEKYGAVNVELTRVTRSIAQNALFHAQISEIAKQTKFNGNELTKDGAKEYLVLLYAFEMERAQTPLAQGVNYIPSRKTEGGWMPVVPRTSKFTVDEGSEFIEFLFSYGAERGVKFNDRVAQQYEEYLAMTDG